MDKGIYTALSGGIAAGHELEHIANNLANASTPGFKRDRGTFNEYLTDFRRPETADGVAHEIQSAAAFDGRPNTDKSFVEMDGVYTDYSQGTMQATKRPLDLGLEGKGFFEVLTPGGVRYTRQGNFTRSADGMLVTTNGYPVLSRGAAPPEQRVIRLQNEPLTVSEDGQLLQNGAVVGNLSLQEFQESQWLEKTGNAYYRNTDVRNLKAGAEDTKIHQGFIEGSNVNPVREMTRLIEATRAYESHMQAIKTFQEVDGQAVNQLAK